jgi:hypothetical protein
MMELRIRLQLAEAFGPDNRWYCSEAYGRNIDDPELLLRYYVGSGGAADFADRFNQAMGMLNRWYCSQFYQCDVRDPRILWEYYMKHATGLGLRGNPRCAADGCRVELSIAC